MVTGGAPASEPEPAARRGGVHSSQPFGAGVSTAPTISTFAERIEPLTSMCRPTSVQRLDTDVRAGAGRHIELARRTSAELFAAVKEVSVATIHRARVLASDGVAAVCQGSAQTIAEAKNESRASADFVLERAQSHTLRVRAAVDVSYAVMSQGARRAVQDAKSRGEALMREIAGQGPEKTLEHGLVMIRDVGGKPVTRVTRVALGQVVSVQFSDGAVGAQVGGVKK